VTIPQANSLYFYTFYASLFFGCVAFVSLLVSGYLIDKKYKKVIWQRTQAVVQKSSIQMHPRGRVGGFNYSPVISYSYVYEGLNYTSTVLSPELNFPVSSDPEYAKKWVELFPPLSNINAYVDSENPSKAVLFPDYRDRWLYDSFLYAFAGVGFVNIVFYVLYFFN
jgi:hypothetical protein